MGDSTNLALVLLAAFWSGTSTVFTGIKETNAIRDRLVIGTIDGAELTRKDCWHTFWWDWAPMKLSLALISAVLCAVILELPNLRGGYGKDQNFANICLIAAAMPALGAMYQFVSFVSDALYLKARRNRLGQRSFPSPLLLFDPVLRLGLCDRLPHVRGFITTTVLQSLNVIDHIAGAGARLASGRGTGVLALEFSPGCSGSRDPSTGGASAGFAAAGRTRT
jgi:hypothetical protein